MLQSLVEAVVSLFGRCEMLDIQCAKETGVITDFEFRELEPIAADRTRRSSYAKYVAGCREREEQRSIARMHARWESRDRALAMEVQPGMRLTKDNRWVPISN